MTALQQMSKQVAFFAQKYSSALTGKSRPVSPTPLAQTAPAFDSTQYPGR
jgi:hypothetical protein